MIQDRGNRFKAVRIRIFGESGLDSVFVCSPFRIALFTQSADRTASTYSFLSSLLNIFFLAPLLFDQPVP